MKTYKVRKGLDTTLRIQGMNHNYFYLWFGIGIVLFLVNMILLFLVINTESSVRYYHFLLMLCISFGAFLYLKFYFIKLSDKKKLSLGKREVTISNSDIFETLKIKDNDSNS